MFRADHGHGAKLLDDAKDANRDIGAVVRVAHVLDQDFFVALRVEKAGLDRDERHCSAFLVEHDQNNTDELISPSIFHTVFPDLTE